jgi:hypothetical protein
LADQEGKIIDVDIVTEEASQEIAEGPSGSVAQPDRSFGDPVDYVPSPKIDAERTRSSILSLAPQAAIEAPADASQVEGRTDQADDQVVARALDALVLLSRNPGYADQIRRRLGGVLDDLGV